MSPLHLVRLPLSLPALARWAAARNYGWTTRRDQKGREQDADFDEGRALHHLLVESFGAGVLTPFRLMVAPRSTQAHVYAYSRSDQAALRDAAQSYALPEVAAVCDWTQLDAKPLPESWRTGRRIGFEIRIKPVSRIASSLPNASGAAFAKGAELDAFLIEALRRFPQSAGEHEQQMTRAGRSRQAVYVDWLAERLKGAVTLESDVRLAHFLRRRAARKNFAPEGPDATLQGNLVIVDPARFQELLAKGVGRHKAYGFGMLLLRPPRIL
jgi:CRISPR system Cascade subunit CasE